MSHLIPIDEVVHFDVCTHVASTGAVSDADSAPTFSVYEEDTDTAILGPTSMTKRTSLTGNYRGNFTASAANGFEAGKWYSVIVSATVSTVAAKTVGMHFRVAPAESSAGVPKGDVSHFGGTAGTFSSGRPEVNTTHAAGTAWGSGAITAASIAADAITAAKIADGAIDAATFAAGAITAAAIASDAITDAKVASDVTIASVTGAVGSVTGNVTGSVGSIATGGISAASFAAGAIDSAAIAANAIGASELAADAVAEIADAVWDEALSGHLSAGSTGEALNAAGAAGDPWTTALPGAYSAGQAGYIVGTNLNATVSSRASQSSVDTIDGIVDSILLDTAEIGAAGAGLTALASASNLATLAGYVDTEVAAILAAVDTEVAAIKAKTDNLPSDPADASDIAASFSTVNSTLSTIAGYIDTEVAAILAAVDTEVGAIKTVTDKLNDTVEITSDGYIFTVAALQQAPSGTGASATDIADEVQTRTIAAVTVVNGFANNTITAAALASDAGTELATAVWASGTRTLTAIDEDSTTLDFDATIRAAVGMASADLDTQLGDIATDAAAADVRGERTVCRGTVTTGASTTSIPTSALTPAGAAADQFKGRIIIFDIDTTTAALRGQATDITASSNSSTPTFTVTALTSTPASGDTFTIV